MTLATLAGTDLGTRVVAYTERDAILYALAVGAPATELDLVFERRLRVLPTFALPLGLWVADEAGARGAFRPEAALHGAQTLRMHRPLPRAGSVEIAGRLVSVWDKGRSAVLDVVAESDFFTATYAIFLPGQGGFGGEPGPRPAPADPAGPRWTGDVATGPDQAALYRLTGDRHLIHIDPAAATAAGFERPVLHGLCTLGVVARALAAPAGAAPWELTGLSARFSAPVLPGETLRITASGHRDLQFDAAVAGVPVLTAGHASFG
jgi:acyl dehydratase